MSVKFDYQFTKSGWAEGLISLGKKRLDFKVNYFSDPLGDLLGSLVAITPGYAEMDFSTEKPVDLAEFDWKGEPEAYEWTMVNRGGNKLDIEILMASDWMGGSNSRESVLKGSCNFSAFLKEVTDSSTLLLQRHGFVGYSNSWGNGKDFPIVNLLKLKYYLAHQTVQEVKNEEGALYFSSFSEEIESLKKS